MSIENLVYIRREMQVRCDSSMDALL